ncbi:outer membrane beta-barrel protein [Pedobacter sp. L105]|uniref:outer membrane beta-barrel protein n=1 Tax=Pedobacter sp. L105 TaxID=1641871 RepID=UPI00131D428B|nr:outer membrane beta-barrel protein [Pedobacter sp. L105]
MHPIKTLFSALMFSIFKINFQLQLAFRICSVFILTIFLTDIAAGQTVKENNKNNLAADSSKNRYEIGVSGGVSLNQFTKGQPHTSLNTGYTAGLSVNYKLFKNISVQLEVNSLQQGGRMLRFIDDTSIGLPESFETKNVTNSSYVLNSIEIPFLINYTFKIKPTWAPSIYVGGSYAHTYNVTENYQKTGDLLPGEDIIVTASDSRNVTSSFNGGRINLIFGANIKLPLTSRLLLLIDMRYLEGLTSAIDNYSYMNKVGFGSNLRTNSFLSKIGIILPIR